MPKTRKYELVEGQYYHWRLSSRDGVYYADGRSNTPNLGRHSLGTRVRTEAITAIKQLDLIKAVEHGLADRSLLHQPTDQMLSLQEGRALFERHLRRPEIAGGPRAATRKRYRAVLDKFFEFAAEENLHSWNQVKKSMLDAYAAWLDDRSYAPRTEYLELNTIKQIIKFLIDEQQLPASCHFKYSIKKPQGSDTYCWEPEEFKAMVQRCRQQAELQWLGHIIVTLGASGLRIEELAALRWTDIDEKASSILVKDESYRSHKGGGGQKRTTKSGCSRSIPLHSHIKEILAEIPRYGDGLVFHGPRGGRIKPDTVRRCLIRDVLTPLAVRFSESRFIEGRLHSFRHFFCSSCAQSGIPERTTMEWMGHADSEMVRYYYHLHDQESQRQICRVNLFPTADVRPSSTHLVDGGPTSPQRTLTNGSTTTQPD